MKHRQHRLSRLIQASFASSAVAFTGVAWAQDADAPQAPASAASGAATDLSKVTVTGFRASLQRAMEVKRNSNSIVDAISAEDIGKFPDRNAAESLAHLPGITVDRLYGEGEKISINGTDPQLNRVLVNGQTIATGDWGGAPGDTQGGRTFNYTLLAPEIIGLMEVYKTPEARIDEGSIGGTVIIHTRKPLELPANTLRGSIGYLYNDRSENGDPRGSFIYSWKNDNSTFGGLISLTHDKNRLNQAGVQFFCGYDRQTKNPFPATTKLTGDGNFSNGVRVPVCLDSGPFEQQRTRNGSQGALQWKVDEHNELNLTGIYIKGKYDNFSQARYFLPIQYGNYTAANVSNGLITSGTLAPTTPASQNTDVFGELDANYRTSDLTTKSLNLTHDFTVNTWKLKSQVGYTKATGGQNPEYLMKWLMKGGGYSFNYGNQSAGVTLDDPSAANWRLDGPGTPGGGARGDQVGGIDYDTTDDHEHYAQMDLSKEVEWGPVKEVVVGAKWLRHQNSRERYNSSIFPTASVSLSQFEPRTVGASLYQGLDVNQGLASWPTASPDAVKAYLNSNQVVYYQGSPNPPGYALDPTRSFVYDPGSFFNVTEETKNLYTQFNYEFDKVRGNFGVRYVDTSDDSAYYFTDPNKPTVPPAYTLTSNTYRKFLPSFNLAYDVDADKTARFSVAKVIARSRYSDLAGATNRDDLKLQGGGGNPNLKPYASTNVDLAGEWYFKPRSMLGFELFYRHIDNYVVNITNDVPLLNPLSNKVDTYAITSPFNGAKANVRGASLLYQQDLAYGFGALANYTYTTASTSSGLNMPYLSKNSYSITPYFESGPYSARFVYSYRTSYFTQVGRLNGSQFTGAYKSLDFSASYQFDKHVAITFNATNLLDTTYYQYDTLKEAPIGFYKNGRLFIVGMNFTL